MAMVLNFFVVWVVANPGLATATDVPAKSPKTRITLDSLRICSRFMVPPLIGTRSIGCVVWWPAGAPPLIHPHTSGPMFKVVQGSSRDPRPVIGTKAVPEHPPVRGVAQADRKSVWLVSANAPDVPFCAAFRMAMTVVLARCSGPTGCDRPLPRYRRSRVVPCASRPARAACVLAPVAAP